MQIPTNREDRRHAVTAEGTSFADWSSPNYTVNDLSGETVDMRNITVSVDEETHRHARSRAAELGTSVSALVRGYLRSLATNQGGDVGKSETGLERRRRLLRDVFADFDGRGVGLRMTDNLPRSALYDRDALR